MILLDPNPVSPLHKFEACDVNSWTGGALNIKNQRRKTYQDTNMKLLNEKSNQTFFFKKRSKIRKLLGLNHEQRC